MDDLISNTRADMQKALDVLQQDVSTLRTGRATPSLVENISVSVYGGTQKLRVLELATVGALDHQTLTVTPFDGSILDEIRKGIMEANVGFTPVVDGPLIRISVPTLSEDRRAELVALMRQKLENGKIMVRQMRQEAMNDSRKNSQASEDEKSRIEKEVQNITDEYMGQIDLLGKKKEEELMQI